MGRNCERTCVKKITCHRKDCKVQVSSESAFRHKEDRQWYCSKRCAIHNHSQPKLKVAFVLTFLEGVYEKRLKSFELQG